MVAVVNSALFGVLAGLAASRAFDTTLSMASISGVAAALVMMAAQQWFQRMLWQKAMAGFKPQ